MTPMKPDKEPGMLLENTARGFSIINFRDDYDKSCSLQKSSSAEADKIWLGVDDANAKYLVKGEGWKEYKLPDGVETFTRMHLTQEQVKQLLPYLNAFVETGELEPVPASTLPATIQGDVAAAIEKINRVCDPLLYDVNGVGVGRAIQIMNAMRKDANEVREALTRLMAYGN